MASRRGFALSIETVVVLVLGVLLLGLGTTIVSKIIAGGEVTLSDITREQRAWFLQEYQRGESFVVANPSLIVEAGHTASIPLGIRNILGDTATFTIEVKIFDDQGTEVTSQTSRWANTQLPRPALARGESAEFYVHLKPLDGAAGAPAGIYTVILKAKVNGQYPPGYDPQIVTLEVQ